jgi:arabinose-5-phosphate isomerase
MVNFNKEAALTMIDAAKVIKDAQNVFEIEMQELERVKNTIGQNFVSAVEAIHYTQGKVIIMGMGKSGIIGRKIAASLASTGTPSFFVHPAEAFHGDLGMFQKEDTVVLISNSGETDELLKILSFFRFNGNKTISITGNANSTLAANSTHHILCKVENEACPLQLAPTSSTTSALVIGDAITVTLINIKGFKPENFARFHPGGTLGRKLLTVVKDVMISEDLPLVSAKENIKNVIHKISSAGYGVAMQVASDNKLEGIITDGDIRRAMEYHEHKFFQLKAEDISTKSPMLAGPNDQLTIIEDKIAGSKIRALVVVDNSHSVLGLLFL